MPGEKMTETKAKILVVDDEQGIVDTLCFLLEGEGFETYGAKNGQEALQVLADQNISAVVCDLIMPKMNGLKFLSEVREQKSLLPFIFLSGNATNEDNFQMVSLGAYRLLDKMEIMKVPDTLRDVIKQHQELEKIQNHSTEETEEFLKILHSTV
jgi:DNA-binding NtrC family response regulator